MKNTLNIKPEDSIGEEIASQIRITGSKFTVTMVDNCDSQETAILVDQDWNDITIIQAIGNKVMVTYLDEKEIAAIKALLL